MSIPINSSARFLGRIGLAITAGGLLACGPDVISDRDSSIPVPVGSTYSWGGVGSGKLPGEIDLPSENSIAAGRVEKAINAQMAAKGWRLVDSTQATFHIHYHVGIHAQAQTVTDIAQPPAGLNCGVYNCYGGGYEWGYYGPPEATTTREVVYREGALMIDLEDAKSGKLAWRGLWKNEATGQQPTEERVNKVVGQTMKGLPSVK
jgi:hypothetical protein